MGKRKVSISLALFQKKFGDRRALEIAKEIGADGVDFDLLTFDYTKEGNIYSKGDVAVREYFSSLREYAKELGVEIAQTHGRIKGFVNDKEKDDALVENGRLDCIATNALGTKYCVMHTTTTIHMGVDAPEELMYRLNYDMYTRILPYAKQEGVVIATETFGDATGKGCIDFFGDYEHFKKGYDDVIVAHPEFKENFCICMDTGHSNKSTRFEGNPPVPEVIEGLGNKIKVLHLNDNDTLTDQHKIPRAGTVDWEATMLALDKIGYNGWYNLEVNLRNFGGEDFAQVEAEFAVKVMRRLLQMYYEN